MIIQRRFAPTRGRFGPESVAGFAGINNEMRDYILKVLRRRDLSRKTAINQIIRKTKLQLLSISNVDL